MDDMTPRHIAHMLQRYSERGSVAANRLYSVTRRLFNYAVEAGYLDSSPAAGLSRRVAGGAEHHRDRVLTDDEIRALWTRGGQLATAMYTPDGPTSARLKYPNIFTGDDIVDTSWNEALTLYAGVAKRLLEQHGPDKAIR